MCSIYKSFKWGLNTQRFCRLPEICVQQNDKKKIISKEFLAELSELRGLRAWDWDSMVVIESWAMYLQSCFKKEDFYFESTWIQKSFKVNCRARQHSSRKRKYHSKQNTVWQNYCENKMPALNESSGLAETFEASRRADKTPARGFVAARRRLIVITMAGWPDLSLTPETLSCSFWEGGDTGDGDLMGRENWHVTYALFCAALWDRMILNIPEISTLFFLKVPVRWTIQVLCLGNTPSRDVVLVVVDFTVFFFPEGDMRVFDDDFLDRRLDISLTSSDMLKSVWIRTSKYLSFQRPFKLHG